MLFGIILDARPLPVNLRALRTTRASSDLRATRLRIVARRRLRLLPPTIGGTIRGLARDAVQSQRARRVALKLPALGFV